MQKVFNVAVDIGRKLPAPAFEVNTNDLKSVKLIITITNGQTLLNLTDTTVRIAIRKPDSHIIFQDCTVKDAESGQVEIVLENQAYITPGTHTAEIMCYKGSEVVAVSGTFSYKSTKGIMNDEAVKSKSEFTSISNMLKDVQETIDDVRENGTGIDAQARQDIKSVTTQLAEIETEYEDDGGLKLSEIAVPQYAIDAFAPTIEKINTHKTANSIIFGAITDPHLGTVRWAGRTAAYHLKAISLFSQRQRFPFILGMGDMVDGANTGENVRHCLKESAKCFEGADCDVLLAKGDHDINANYLYNYASTNPYNVEPSSIITKNDWNEIMVTPELTGGNLVTNSTDADLPKFKPNYFYKDYENEKIRVIVLDTMDTFHSINKYFADQLYTRGRFTYGFNNSQLNWLANTALDFSSKPNKSDWVIILTSHCNPKKAATEGDMRNSNVAIGLVKACMNGTSYTIPSQAGEFSLTPQTVDFATKNGGGIKVAGWLHGHDHRDLHEVDGFNIIGIVNSYGLFLDNSDRHINKLLEDAWSVFVLNKDTRQLVEVRYGYSDSNNPTGLRTFTY